MISGKAAFELRESCTLWRYEYSGRPRERRSAGSELPNRKGSQQRGPPASAAPPGHHSPGLAWTSFASCLAAGTR